MTPSAATSRPSTLPDTTILPVTFNAPVAAVPVVTILCEPNCGSILVPAMAADALTSALTIVPSAIFAEFIAESAILAVVIFKSLTLAVVTAMSCIRLVLI